MGKFYLYSLGSFGDFTTFANLSAITYSRVLVCIVGTSSERASAMLGVTKTQTRKTQTSDPENSDPLKSKVFSILFT